MFSPLLYLAFAFSAPSAPQDAPDRLITAHGVELRADEDVFLLFAALNAAGYTEETRRKGPPLRAPIFHDIRRRVRDVMRTYRERSAVKNITLLFERNAMPLEDYLAAALADGGLGPETEALQAKLGPALNRFGQQVRVTEVFDDLASAQRAHAQQLKDGLEVDLTALTDNLADPSFRAPTEVVVVPNPLDAHATVRRVKTDREVVLVVGPDHPTARRAILEEVLKPYVRTAVDKHYRRAPAFKRSWGRIKSSRRIAQRYGSGQNYLTEALVRAMAFRVRANVDGQAGREADEAFIDEQARSGMRWARVALRVVDRVQGKKLDKALGPALAQSTP